MLSYCGIDCEECEAFIATKSDDKILKEKVKNNELKTQEAMKVQDAATGDDNVFSEERAKELEETVPVL